MNVSIIGATGYGGAELVRILQAHPDVAIYSVHSSSRHGTPMIDSYPHMQTVADLLLEDIDVDILQREVDLVFLATPSGVSAKLAPKLLARGLKVIDLSGDFRLKDRQMYKSWYGKEAGDYEWLKKAVYGLTEWVEEDLQQVDFIANPGCYPTATLLGLAPLVKSELIDPSSIIVDAKSGVSGAGRGISETSHFSETNESTKIYKVNAHQHTPEIEQMLVSWNDAIQPITFSTHLVPMTRGIMATIYVDAMKETNLDEIYNLYMESYKDVYFVRVREKGVFPSTKEVAGSNFCDLGLAYDERTQRITIVSVIDNLVKGAAGQAVQNMNKMLGMDEKTGLAFVPIYP
ncbi:MAG TPA: N-acetyl-gamma-glutamyl-phosphate reductase [Bacillota bacterium]